MVKRNLVNIQSNALSYPLLVLVSNKPTARRHEDNLDMDWTSSDVKELLILLSVVIAQRLYFKNKINLPEMQMEVFTAEMTQVQEFALNCFSQKKRPVVKEIDEAKFYLLNLANRYMSFTLLILYFFI